VPHGRISVRRRAGFPLRLDTPKLAVDSVFASSKSKPVGRRPTENNHVTPSPEQERSNGYVAPPPARRSETVTLPPNRPLVGVGSPVVNDGEDVTPVELTGKGMQNSSRSSRSKNVRDPATQY
jgi:hypothetical protein